LHARLRLNVIHPEFWIPDMEPVPGFGMNHVWSIRQITQSKIFHVSANLPFVGQRDAAFCM
jgi:hypothetical protein